MRRQQFKAFSSVRFVFIFLAVTGVGGGSAEQNFSWQEIDRQDRSYVKAVYAGDYADASSQLSELVGQNDRVANYLLGIVNDSAAHKVHCRGSRACEPKSFRLKKGMELSGTVARRAYKVAIAEGHPYAAYMLIGHYEFNHKLPPDSLKLQALSALEPLMAAGDGVAAFMYYDIEMRALFFYDGVGSKTRREISVRLDESIEKLCVEAMQGRILAMHYLGRAYSNKLEFAKSFAWFTVAAKHQHWPSVAYQKMVANQLDVESEMLAADETKRLLALFGMTTNKGMSID